MNLNNPIQAIQKNVNLEVSKRGRKARKTHEIKIIETHKLEDSFFSGAAVLLPDDTKEFSSAKIDYKKDDRPIAVCPDGHIFFETFSPHAKIAKDFLDLIASPVSLPLQVQEYQINTNSLNNAVQKGLTSKEIIRVLTLLSKNKIDEILINLITKTCASFSGSLNLLSSNNSYLIYSDNIPHLQKAYRLFLPFVDTKKASELNIDPKDSSNDENFFFFDNFDIAKIKIFGPLFADQKSDNKDDTEHQKEFIITPEIAKEAFKDTTNDLFCFHLLSDKIEDVNTRAKTNELQLINEYDFRNDTDLNNIDISIRKEYASQLYRHQNEAMMSLFKNSYLRSGIITLPYGSGKSVIGAMTVATIKKPTIIFCENILSIDQWYSNFLKFTTIDDLDLARFTQDSKDEIPSDVPCVIITTYAYFLSQKNSIFIQKICEKKWGLVIFDELKDELFDLVKIICQKLTSRSKLGLAPFPIKDDRIIRSLNFLIGPQLFNKALKNLCEDGVAPRVQCSIVYCKMTRPFYKEYLHAPVLLTKRLVAGLNPNKIMALERLIRMHEERGDKIIVYAEILFILEECADRLFVEGKRRRPLITVKTPKDEIESLFGRFRFTDEVNCLFMSRIVDKEFDIPPANVLIQLCPHHGSKIPESQRFLKLLKPKFGRSCDQIHNAYFYTLVSDDTKEVFYSNRNRQLLIEQGFNVKLIYKYRKNSSFKQKLCVQSAEAQIELFNEIISVDPFQKGMFEVLDEEKNSPTTPNQHISRNLPSASQVAKKVEPNKYKLYVRK
ncbi:TFIIH basal transcription factor complex helicase XPB subunit [Tritrichomonas musculus]|uniref:DNA 3'-5' helicase n=1 Tax=Tritrichomonas musculus TaxID=1915356 RepID=A0ABR2JW88_9EUKA